MEFSQSRRRHNKYEPPSFLTANKIRVYRDPLDYNIKLINRPSEVDFAVRDIYRKCTRFPVIGLDCEWTPVRRKNQKADVALLQIATIDGSCVLFRTCMMDKIPDSLAELLADPAIVKVGVGISTDAANLKDKFNDLIIRGCFDLRHMARMCNIFSEKESLGGLAKSLLDIQLQKDIILDCIWESKNLKETWIQYAALDALVGVRIFEKLLPLLHEQESDEPFNIAVPSGLIKKYFINSDSPCYQFLDRKL